MLKVFYRFPLVGLMILSISACSGFQSEEQTDNAKPLELVKLQTQAQIFKKQWHASTAPLVGAYAVLLTPVVDGSVLYSAAESGKIEALNLSDGKTLWSYKAEGKISAALGEDVYHLYAVTANSKLIAVNKTDGKLVWSSQLQGGAVATPASNNLVVVVHSVNGKVSGFDPHSGNNYWVHQESTPEVSVRGNSQPQFLGSQWVVQGLDNGKILALRAQEGGIAWERRVNLSNINSGSGFTDIDLPILFNEKGMIYTTQSNSLIMISSETGDVEWQGDFDEPIKSITLLGAILVTISESDKVFVNNAGTGELLWVNEALKNRKLSRPAISNTHIYVVDLDGIVHALALKNGKFDARLASGLGQTTNAPILQGNQMLLMDDRGRIEAYQVQIAQ